MTLVNLTKVDKLYLPYRKKIYSHAENVKKSNNFTFILIVISLNVLFKVLYSIFIDHDLFYRSRGDLFNIYYQ